MKPLSILAALIVGLALIAHVTRMFLKGELS